MKLVEKIQAIRIALNKKSLKMSGKNNFANYEYFELNDFLPILNELMQENKMTAIPSFSNEYATLTAFDFESDEKIIISSPMGTADLKGCHEVQNIGAVETYQRRYLYQALFDIAENDSLNKTQGKPDDKALKTKFEPKPTTYICEECKKLITDAESNYSKKYYAKVLCRDCQKKIKLESKKGEPIFEEETMPQPYDNGLPF